VGSFESEQETARKRDFEEETYTDASQATAVVNKRAKTGTAECTLVTDTDNTGTNNLAMHKN
jgi:hypothetical protein